MGIIRFLSLGRRSKKLSAEIKNRLPSTTKIKIVSGFLSKEGFNALFGPTDREIRDNGKKIEYIVVGRLTLECAEIFDQLYSMPEYRNKLYVNLGLGRLNKKGDAIDRFLPMIHSKIIALDPTEKKNMFYIGSANLTHFAIEDYNAEAGIILTDIEISERDEISNYMDNLKNLRSTIPYDPSLKDSLIFLSNLSRDPLEKDFENIEPCLIVLALNPTGYKPKKGDVLFADLPRHLPEEIIKFHQKTKRHLVLLLFDNLHDLIKMSFEKATVVYTRTESFNDIMEANMSIEQNINGMIYYDTVLPPVFIPMKFAPSVNPKDFHSQMKCKVITYADIPKKLFDLFNFENYKQENKKIDNVVIRKRAKATQDFKISEYNTIPIKDGVYGEILSFKRIGEYSTLSELKEKLSWVDFEIPGVEQLEYHKQYNSMVDVDTLPKDDTFHIKFLNKYKSLLGRAIERFEEIKDKEHHNFIFQISSIIKNQE